MPYKDPKKRKAKNREYAKAYAERQGPKSPGTCSVLGCSNATSDSNKKCDAHLAYMREYKKKYRAQAKPEGVCTNADCVRQARVGFRLCELCNERSKAKQKLPASRISISRRNQEIQEEVVLAYGGQCVCCGEQHIHFLSIDHIDGYDTKSPRKGGELYRWIKRNGFPAGFRVLCMSCNFALGHHGYCPHNNLTQVCRVGRRTDRVVSEREKQVNREHWILRKLEVFHAYGGPFCRCCGEAHLECLSIDHINNDGAAHRKELTGDARDGRNLYIWLRQNGFPPGFQVLCVNCNFARGHFQICPHDLERQVLAQ